MFHVLPCRFNRQTSIQYLQPPMEQHFELFHACLPKSENVITHTNGCGPYPGACHIEPESANYTGTYWKTHSSYMEVRRHLIKFLWRIIYHLFCRTPTWRCAGSGSPSPCFKMRCITTRVHNMLSRQLDTVCKKEGQGHNYVI